MYADNFFINDGIIYENTYGCSKQYICENVFWTLLVSGFTYRVVIDRFINVTGQGRSKIDGINGSDQSYSRQKCA